MEKWNSVKLGEITQWMSGGTPRKNKPEYWNGDIPWISANSMHTHRINDSDLKITKKGLDNGSKIAPQNSILLLVRGSALHSRIPVGIAMRDVAFNQDVKAIIPDENKVNPWFLFAWFIAKRDYLLSSVEFTGIGAGKFDTTKLQNIELQLPNLEEQNRIAYFAKLLDDKIELNRKMNATLEEMARAVFKAWFVDFEPVHANAETRPSTSASPEIAKLFPSEFQESELGLIPKGWKDATFSELFSFVVDNRGKTPPKGSDGIRLVEGFQIDYEQAFPDFSNQQKQKLIPKDIYDSWFRAGHPIHLDILCATVGTLPKWCFAPSKTLVCIAQNVIALRVDEKIASPYFAKCLMNTNDFLWNFNSRIVTTAQPSIKVGPLKAIPILLPPKEVINEFDKQVKPMYKQIENLYYQTTTLSEIRDSLLPRLISGKIPVGEIEKEVEEEVG